MRPRFVRLPLPLSNSGTGSVDALAKTPAPRAVPDAGILSSKLREMPNQLLREEQGVFASDHTTRSRVG